MTSTKSAMLKFATLGILLSLAAVVPAAEEPGDLQIYRMSGPLPARFPPRPLTPREQELIHQIVAAGADFHALYVPDVLVGEVEFLSQPRAEFCSFTIRCRSPEVSQSVRPLADELGLPVGLSLGMKSGTGGEQLKIWSGCAMVRRLFLLSPELEPEDFDTLADYPALENLQLGSPSGSRTVRRQRSGVVVTRPRRRIISDPTIVAIARIDALRRLAIFGREVTATNFDRLQQLKTLYVQNTELDGASFVSCSRLDRLNELNLSRSVAHVEQPVALSGLKSIQTLQLPWLADSIEKTLTIATHLDQLTQLNSLGFSGLRCDGWPEFDEVPETVTHLDLHDLLVDDFAGLGFENARLQALRLRLTRTADAQFAPLESVGHRFEFNAMSTITGELIEPIRVDGAERSPPAFGTVRFLNWTPESQFFGDATFTPHEFPNLDATAKLAAQQLARFGLRVGQEPLGGGIALRPPVDVYLRWDQPAARAGDVSQIVDALVQLPLEKLVITTDDFPLDRLSKIGQISTLKILELRRAGLADDQLQIVQSWDQLENLSIVSPDNTFSPEALGELARRLPNRDLSIASGAGRPLLYRRRQPSTPTSQF